MMIQARTLKTVSRAAALLFLLLAALGPWFADGHPATQQTCSHPLVWLGNGYCACLVTIKAIVEGLFSNRSFSWLFCLPPALPFLSTLLLFLIGERRWLRVCHLAAWGIAGIYAFLWFGGVWYAHRGILILWGAGLGGVVAIAILVVEILLPPNRTPSHKSHALRDFDM